MSPIALRRRRSLADSGIEAEVIDLRTIRPLDRATILESLSRTNRLVAVEEGPLTGGWAGEVLAVAVEGGLTDIDAAWRITTPDRPMPFSAPLEDAFFPTATSIAESVLSRVALRSGCALSGGACSNA